jgi:hypothetical protein
MKSEFSQDSRQQCKEPMPMISRIAIVAVLVAVLLGSVVAFAPPAAAQGGGCKAFGQNVAALATGLGSDFGQTTSSNAPLNGVVEAEQDALCS